MSRISVSLTIALIVFTLIVGSASAAEQTWTNVPVVDTQCITKVKDNPDAHTRKCALGCAKGGYGLIAEDGTYLKFDVKGNEKTLEALKSSSKADHLRATVTGELNGESINVTSISFE